MTEKAIARRAAVLAVRGLLVAGLAAGATGCKTTARDTTGSIPQDYRERHPITVKEGKRTLTVLVGSGRGGLTPMQRAEVLAFARTWSRDATGGITIDRPKGTPNERAASDTLKETLSILVSAGVPNHGIGINPYSPGDPNMAPLRLRYPRMVADAGPCGLWPADLGPNNDIKHFDNEPYYNIGCATQRNLARMVDNPADVIQPRAETPAYTAKRSTGMESGARARARRQPIRMQTRARSAISADDQAISSS